MKIAICDDVPQFVAKIEAELGRICKTRGWAVDCIGFTSSALLLNTDLSSVQVVFLDIDMPEKDGLETARLIREKYPEIVLVFVTAFLKYAPAGYRVSAFRYLLKQHLERELPEVMDDIRKSLLEASDSMLVEQKSGAASILLKNIVYLEGTPRRMVLLHTADGAAPVEALGKLTDYEKKLEGKGFLRLQRSFIANMAFISKISSYRVFLKNGLVLNASEKYYRHLNASFLRWKGEHL